MFSSPSITFIKGFDGFADTLKAYLLRNKLGKYDEQEMQKKQAEKKKEEELEAERLKTISVDSRCQVSVPGQPTRRATVKSVGENKSNMKFKELKLHIHIGVFMQSQVGKLGSVQHQQRQLYIVFI